MIVLRDIDQRPSVFPEPVLAAPIRSFPARHSGMDLRCVAKISMIPMVTTKTRYGNRCDCEDRNDTRYWTIFIYLAWICVIFSNPSFFNAALVLSEMVKASNSSSLKILLATEELLFSGSGFAFLVFVSDCSCSCSSIEIVLSFFLFLSPLSSSVFVSDCSCSCSSAEIVLSFFLFLSPLSSSFEALIDKDGEEEEDFFVLVFLSRLDIILVIRFPSCLYKKMYDFF